MRRITLAAAAAALLVALPARAEYGALDTRAWGRATDMATPRDADGTALSYCRSGGCRVIVRTGPGQCGAIAASQYGSRYHWSTRYNRYEAESAAIAGCQAEAGQPCQLIVVQCNR